MRLRGPRIFASVLAMAASAGAFAQEPSEPLALPAQIGGRLAKCWTPPASRPPETVEVTVRLMFSSSGAVIGEPRIAYIRGPAGLREEIAKSALAAVKACSPLPFTPSLGAAIAGRLIAVRLRSLPAAGKGRAV